MMRVLSVHIGFFTLLSALACDAKSSEPRFAREPARETRTLGEGNDKASAQAPVTPPQAPPGMPTRGSMLPSSPDPMQGQFTLAQALDGMPKKGKLQASIDTSEGTLECTLFDDKAPLTVANFVGLARGLRPFWDAREGAWVKRPLYDGTTFHRVIAEFMIQGGDHLGTGTGDVGYNVPDELHPSLKHDRAGLLCMANKGPNTNGGQFFITDAAAPHLTAMKTYTIFGDCQPVDVVHKIARAPTASPMSERPEPPIAIRKVTITRR